MTVMTASVAVVMTAADLTAAEVVHQMTVMTAAIAVVMVAALTVAEAMEALTVAEAMAETVIKTTY
jgi:hypothetical protein